MNTPHGMDHHPHHDPQPWPVRDHRPDARRPDDRRERPDAEQPGMPKATQDMVDTADTG